MVTVTPGRQLRKGRKNAFYMSFVSDWLASDPSPYNKYQQLCQNWLVNDPGLLNKHQQLS